MKKVIFVLALCVIASVGIYSIFLSHTKIKLNDVNSISINDKMYKSDSDNNIVTDIVSMFNAAKIFRKNVGTTPSHEIMITLKNGNKIDIHGTTQGFHYVSEGSKSYRISSRELSNYLRNLK